MISIFAETILTGLYLDFEAKNYEKEISAVFFQISVDNKFTYTFQHPEGIFKLPPVLYNIDFRIDTTLKQLCLDFEAKIYLKTYVRQYVQM